MSGPFGLVPPGAVDSLPNGGFNPMLLADILAALEADQRGANAPATPGVDPNLITTLAAPIGGLNQALGKRYAELWQLMLQIYQSRDPATVAAATGDSAQLVSQAIDAMCAITGTKRQKATLGLVTLSVTLKPGITLPAGSAATVLGNASNRWVTTQSITNATGVAAVFTVEAQCSQPGALEADAGTITVIATPVNGWVAIPSLNGGFAVTNPLDASQGRPAESNAALLVRRIEEVANPSDSTLGALEAKLSEVQSPVNGQPVSVVVSISVFENTSSYPDAFGRPPRSIEAVVQFVALSGADLTNARQAFAETLFTAKAGSIATYTATGNSALVTGPRGEINTMRWSEVADVPVYVSATVLLDPSAAYPGDQALKEALLAYGQTLGVGAEVFPNRLLVVIMGTVGVIDCPSLTVGLAPSPMTEVPITFGSRQIAKFDTAFITIADVFA